MSNLATRDIYIIRDFFESVQGPGYVLDFTNDTLRRFIIKSIDIDINEDKYTKQGTSKANRITALLEKEPDHIIVKLLNDLLQYGRKLSPDLINSEALVACSQICKRLQVGPNAAKASPARPALYGIFETVFKEDEEIDVFCAKCYPHLLQKIKQCKLRLEKLDELINAVSAEDLARAINYYSSENMLNNDTAISRESPSMVQHAESRKSSTLHGTKILHLSDLHFQETSNSAAWFTQLASDLIHDLECRNLDIIILSGDIASTAAKAEYDVAETFLRLLMREFNLSPEKLIIVPGNHDISWPASQLAYELKRKSEFKDLKKKSFFEHNNSEIIEIRDEEKYKLRFQNFSEFFRNVQKKPYSLDYENQTTLHHFQELNLVVLGINSAWEIDHHFRSRAGVHQEALAETFTELRREASKYRDCIKIATWHHALSGDGEDRIKDTGFLEQLAQAGFSIGLHGHIHETKSDLFRDRSRMTNRNFELVGAGTFGAPTKEWRAGIPLQYQLLQFIGKKLIVHTRKREEPNGAWRADARWQANNKDKDTYVPFYEIEINRW